MKENIYTKETMKTEENKLQTLLQSPLSLTIIVACIAVALVLLLILSFHSHHSAATQQTAMPTGVSQPATMHPAALATATLSFNKNDSSVDVYLTTGATAVSGVQFALSYNPQVLSNVTVTPGTFFPTPVILQNAVDATKGIISYTVVTKVGEQPEKGAGIIATISYTPVAGAPAPTILKFLPQTKITALGSNTSVLKKTTTISLP